MTTLSVFVAGKSAISGIRKDNDEEFSSFNTQQLMFEFAHLLPDISRKSKNLPFQSWRKE